MLGYASNETGQIGGYQFRCGGSLISERFVLTAAHCGPPQVVRLGVFDLREIGDGLIFDVAAFYKHPNYSMNASYDDIALVRITRDVSFTSHVRPACLWTNTALNLTTVIATGFGNLDFGDVICFNKNWIFVN